MGEVSLQIVRTAGSTKYPPSVAPLATTVLMPDDLPKVANTASRTVVVPTQRWRVWRLKHSGYAGFVTLMFGF